MRGTYRINVLYNVLKSRVGSELSEQLSPVKQSVHKVWVMMERVCQTRVDDFKHHAYDFFKNCQIRNLKHFKIDIGTVDIDSTDLVVTSNLYTQTNVLSLFDDLQYS